MGLSTPRRRLFGSPAPVSKGGPVRGARRSTVNGGVAYLGSLVLGGWIISNLDDVAWVAQNGWSWLTDLGAPLVALVAIVGGSSRGWSGLSTVRDGLSFATGVGIVGIATAGTWLWIGPVQSLTPLLIGCAALVVMHAALIERTSRKLTEPASMPVAGTASTELGGQDD